MQVVCTAWKNPVEGDVQTFVNDYKRALLDALVDAGVSRWDLIMRGVRQIKSPFLPNPGQFAESCLAKSEDLGLPSEDEAFRQAVGLATDKHQAVVWALRQINSHSFKLKSDSEARREWRKVWAKTIDHVLAGGELPETPKQLEEKPAPKADKNTAMREINALKNMFA